MPASISVALKNCFAGSLPHLADSSYPPKSAGAFLDWRLFFRPGSDSRCIREYAWHASNSGDKVYSVHGKTSPLGGRTHAVGAKKLNPWGLYDMHGNVWEWFADCYDKSYHFGGKTGSRM